MKQNKICSIYGNESNLCGAACEWMTLESRPKLIILFNSCRHFLSNMLARILNGSIDNKRLCVTGDF